MKQPRGLTHDDKRASLPEQRLRRIVLNSFPFAQAARGAAKDGGERLKGGLTYSLISAAGAGSVGRTGRSLGSRPISAFSEIRSMK